MIVRKTYNNYYKKDFDFPVISNNYDLEKYIKTQIYFEKSPEISIKENYNTKIVNEAKIYDTLDEKSINNTIKYIFEKYRTGVYVKIENNQLTQFVTLYNANFTNDFSEVLKFKEGDANKYFQNKLKYLKFKPPRMNPDTSKWASTNCLLRTELSDEGPTERYLNEFYDMINKTCQNRKVGNCIFFIYRKDFPNLTYNNTEADEHLWNSENKLMKSPYDKAKFVPIFSQSTTVRHANLLLPTGDDWDIITQEFNDYKVDPEFKIAKWEDRKPIVIWRGMSTGCGNDVDSNPRLKLSQMTLDLKAKGIHYLDAGIVKNTSRDKKIFGHEYVDFQRNTKYHFDFIDKVEQTKYKFTINVEGNSAAYRYGSLFRFGFCVLNVESKYKMWFEEYLVPYEHYIPVKHDLSDLIEKIEWCLKNDDTCKKISENGVKFFNKYFNRDFIYDYLSNSFNAIANKMNIPTISQVGYEQMKNYVMTSYKNLELNCSFKKIDSVFKKETIKDTLIIVPYRDNKFQDRKKQLDLFRKHYKDYDILIVEQTDDNRKFNRGALLNIGFKYSYKNYKYFIFHDVDILTPKHLIEKYYFDDLNGAFHIGDMTTKYSDMRLFFGAINKFDNESFKSINGFPNTFWGWGDEDLILYYRCCKKKINLYKPIFTERIQELEHTDTKKIKELTNLTRYEKRLFDNIYNELDGLLQSSYSIVNTEIDGSYKKITVEIK